MKKSHGMSDIYEFDRANLVMRLDITLSAEVAAIAPVVDRILGLVQENKCIAGKEFEVSLAVQEALTNAVIHGAKEDPTKLVEVVVCCDRDLGILIVIRDPGTGFDVASIPSPVRGQRVFATHGRGIFLINRLMDEVHYTRGGAEIRMRKR